MFVLLTILHIVVCLILILVVLLQTGKRADLAGAFGGGGSQTAFGTRGAATFLSKATTISAVIFMVTSLGLAIVSSRPGGSASTSLPLPSQTSPAPQESLPPAPPKEQTPSPGAELPAPQGDQPGGAPAGGGNSP